jgi:hypothetical protein
VFGVVWYKRGAGLGRLTPTGEVNHASRLSREDGKVCNSMRVIQMPSAPQSLAKSGHLGVCWAFGDYNTPRMIRLRMIRILYTEPVTQPVTPRFEHAHELVL